jgi:hypothetical protein
VPWRNAIRSIQPRGGRYGIERMLYEPRSEGASSLLKAETNLRTV